MLKRLMYYFLPTNLLIRYIASHPEAKKEARKYLFEPPVNDEVELKYVYTDKEGNNYYTYADITRMPYKRSISADIAMRYLSMNLTADELEKRTQRIIDACNNKNLVDAAVEVNEIKKRLNLSVEEKTLAEIACVYFLIEGENPSNPLDLAFAAKKKALWSKDIDAKGFFLSRAFCITRNLPEPSEADTNILIQELRRLADSNQ